MLLENLKPKSDYLIYLIAQDSGRETKYGRYMCVRVGVGVWVCVRVWVFVCMYDCMYDCIYVCMLYV